MYGGLPDMLLVSITLCSPFVGVIFWALGCSFSRNVNLWVFKYSIWMPFTMLCDLNILTFVGTAEQRSGFKCCF